MVMRMNNRQPRVCPVCMSLMIPYICKQKGESKLFWTCSCGYNTKLFNKDKTHLTVGSVNKNKVSTDDYRKLFNKPSIEGNALDGGVNG